MMTPPRLTPLRALGGALALALAATAIAQMSGVFSSRHPVSAQPAPAESYAPGHAAMRATLDPETGRVRVGLASAAETLDPGTIEALRRDTEGLHPEYRADGSVRVHLQGRFQSASVAHIGPNGKTFLCSDEADHVAGHLQGTGAATQTLEVQ